ncbi:MAG: hypothetical protein QOJ52_3333 [Acidimicrobiaceae bacterium]|nr:hypothetical protein [Acidimicrobiaceae bacterium]
MFNDRSGQTMSVRTGMGISLLAVLALGAGGCGAAATRAGTTAASVSPAAQSSAATEPAPAAPTAAAAAPQTAAPAPAAATPKATTTVKPPSGTSATSAPKVTNPAPAVTTAPKTAPTLPARRQPTGAEVNQVIASVHALVPLFTPTAAQVATVGNQVCTAFDQGKSLAQVKATAMQMAGVYAALIPDSVATSAVRTVVTMFCPGYISKLV